MRMTVGACTYSWLWDQPLQDAVHRIADLGFRYFELMSHVPHCWPRDWSAADRAAFRRLYESRGLTLSSVNPTFLDLQPRQPEPGNPGRVDPTAPGDHPARLGYDDTVWGHDRIGTGAIDFSAITERVKQIGYDGPTIMEIVDRRAPDESNRVSLDRLRALGWTTGR